MASLTRKVAIVTGASRGIGQAIADVVAFLVSDQARWITGQNIRATGGLG